MLPLSRSMLRICLPREDERVVHWVAMKQGEAEEKVSIRVITYFSSLQTEFISLFFLDIFCFFLFQKAN